MAILATICLVYFYRIHVKPFGAKPQGMILSGVPLVPDSIFRSMARYQSWNSAAFQDWTADGKSMVVITRSGQTNQVHIVDSKKAAPRQITSFSEPVTSVCVCPDPSRQEMLFEKDSGGNENFQIFSADLNAGQPRLLTGGDRSTQNTGAVWSNAGDRFAFASNKRNGIDFDIYISDMKASRLVLARPGSWSCLDWSPDDTKLLVERFRSRTESFIAVLDLKSGQCAPLSDTGDTVSEESAVWAQGGRGIFLTSDQGSLFRTLRYYDCATRRQTNLTGDIAWDVREIAISRDRKRLAFMTNENGFSRVYLMNAATLAFREIPGLPMGGIYHLRFDPSGVSLGMTINLPQHPEECYAVNLDVFSCDRWTASSMGGIDTEALISPQLMQYPTFDSLSGEPRMIPVSSTGPRPAAMGNIIRLLSLCTAGPKASSGRTFPRQFNTLSTNSASLCSPRTSVGPEDTAEGTFNLTTATSARMRRATSGACGLDCDAGVPRYLARLHHGRLLRRVCGAFGHGAIRQPHLMRHRPVRHQQFCHVPRTHIGIPAGPAARRVRRRTRRSHAHLSQRHIASFPGVYKILTEPSDKSIAGENWSELHEGMTPKEVETLIGPFNPNDGNLQLPPEAGSRRSGHTEPDRWTHSIQ